MRQHASPMQVNVFWAEKIPQDKTNHYINTWTQSWSHCREWWKRTLCLWGTSRSGKYPQLNNVQVGKDWILLSLSLVVKSTHNEHLCKILIQLYCRIRWVLDDELHSSLLHAYESKAGATVHWRNISCVLLPHLMGWILLTASLTPGDLFYSKSWWFSSGSPRCQQGAPPAALRKEEGVLQGRFPSSLYHSYWGGIGRASWGCLHPPCWVSGQSQTNTCCATCHGGSDRAVPQGERHHQSCRAVERKPRKFLLSNCFLWAQLAASPLWFAKKIWCLSLCLLFSPFI